MTTAEVLMALTKAPNPTTHSLLIHDPSTITGHQPRPRGDARGAKYGPEHGVLRSPKHPIRPHILYEFIIVH